MPRTRRPYIGEGAARRARYDAFLPSVFPDLDRSESPTSTQPTRIRREFAGAAVCREGDQSGRRFTRFCPVAYAQHVNSMSKMTKNKRGHTIRNRSVILILLRPSSRPEKQLLSRQYGHHRCHDSEYGVYVIGQHTSCSAVLSVFKIKIMIK